MNEDEVLQSVKGQRAFKVAYEGSVPQKGPPISKDLAEK